MSDVFVSYAREDEPRAQQLAEALRSSGYRVWRDEEIPAHRPYAEVIQERLKGAKAVVVLWSGDAAKSQWVRSEADAARHLGTLVQVTIDGSVPPMPFDQIQCADLSSWKGGGETSGWRKLAASIRALAGAPIVAPAVADHKGKASVCVLPFQNMSGDAEQEYFSDGISEDITTDLSKVSALGVTARNTAFMFKGQGVDICDVARKLGVSHVLEGSVRKAGGRVRISAQLIDGANGEHVWAERYDRDLTDIFAIQDEISKAIVDALKVKLLPSEKEAIQHRGTGSAEAYNIYLMARRYWITGNWGDIRQAELVTRLCRAALEIDPAYARVWGLMAIVQSILHFTFQKGEDDGSAAAERALSLDPGIAEAHCVRARRHYEDGRFADADKDLGRALQLAPDSWEVNREAARIFYFQRRFAEAVRHYEKAVSVDDTDYHSWGMLTSAYKALGDKDGVRRAGKMALSQAERVIAQDPTNGAALYIGVWGLAILGEHERAKEWIERGLLLDPENNFMRYDFACVMALCFKMPEEAIDLLEPMFPGFSNSVLKAFIADPDFDSLRGHPRFDRMIEQAKGRLATSANQPSKKAEAPLRS